MYILARVCLSLSEFFLWCSNRLARCKDVEPQSSYTAHAAPSKEGRLPFLLKKDNLTAQEQEELKSLLERQGPIVLLSEERI